MRNILEERCGGCPVSPSRFNFIFDPFIIPQLIVPAFNPYLSFIKRVTFVSTCKSRENTNQFYFESIDLGQDFGNYLILFNPAALACAAGLNSPYNSRHSTL